MTKFGSTADVCLNVLAIFSLCRLLRQWQTATCAATQKTATCAEVAIFRKTTFETLLQNQQDGFNGGALIAVDC